jgi:hypothetical protein
VDGAGFPDLVLARERVLYPRTVVVGKEVWRNGRWEPL